MLVNNKPSYTIQSGGTYSPDAPIDINPESIGNAESSYRFVEPIGGGGEITDYVSKANGGTFEDLIKYPSDLTIIGDYDIVYKLWVDDAIDAKIAAIGAGTVSSVTAGNGMNFSEITATGAITLGTPSTITLATTNSLTSNSHTHAITGVQASLLGTGLVYSTAGVITYDTNTYVATTAFNGLFDARFTTAFAGANLSNLGTRVHNTLTSIRGSSDGYHLSSANYAIASRAADSTQSGYLTAADWNTFNSKMDSLTADGVTVDITGGVISALPAGIDHNSLLNYSITQHRSINDAGIANTDLWSADKIISYVSDANVSFTDITTNNASTTKHGFLPKLNNDITTFLSGQGTWITIPTTEDLDAPVITQIVDNSYNPGASPTNGDRYMILVSSSLHANFGTINKDLNGNALVLQDNDIVQYVTSSGEFRIAFDASAATRNRMVLVETDIYLTDNANWAYSYFTDVWVYRGSSSSHNSLSGIQGGNIDYKYHLDDTQYALVTGITSSAAELNYLDGASVTANRIIRGDGTKFTSDANLTFDGTTLYTNADVNIASGKKYKINNVNLSYSDVGAQPLNTKLTEISGLTLANGDILYVNGSGNISVLNIGGATQVLGVSSGLPSWQSIFTANLVNKIASANVRNSHDAEASTVSTTYVKLKTITFTKGLLGQQRFTFRMKAALTDTGTPSARIYRNGVALGATQTTTSTTYVTKSEDITQDWGAGDTCELWVKCGTFDGDPITTYVDQFRVSYDDNPIVAVPSTNS